MNTHYPEQLIRNRPSLRSLEIARGLRHGNRIQMRSFLHFKAGVFNYTAHLLTPTASFGKRYRLLTCPSHAFVIIIILLLVGSLLGYCLKYFITLRKYVILVNIWVVIMMRTGTFSAGKRIYTRECFQRFFQPFLSCQCMMITQKLNKGFSY